MPMMNEKMKIYVISHKEFCMPTNNPIYQPLLVGNIERIPGKEYCFDHTGDHISEKNCIYNELTGMYWVWKNVQEDVVGICHYRRYFVSPMGKVENLLSGKQDHFLDGESIQKLLGSAKMIVHNKTFFRENNRIQFSEGVNPYFWDIMEQEMLSMYPDYIPALQITASRKYAHLLNMMIAKKDTYDRYCEWLFPLLFRIEEQLKKNAEITDLSRSMGMIGERLLDVWLLKNRIKIKECFSINTERKDWKAW